jgi:5-formyltetrahydrofolate cyclo-ligase
VTFHTVRTLHELSEGTYGILEPARSLPSPDPRSVELVLVPGRAFDAAGGRLGRGKGGYDRWAAAQRSENPRSKFFGVAFDEQIIKSVPMEEHDQRVDAVFTAKGNRMK